MFLPLKDNLPKASFPLMTFVLIALNIAVYLMASSTPMAATDAAILYGVIPYELMHSGVQCVPVENMTAMACGTTAEIQAIYPGIDLPPTWLTVGTSMFLHGGLAHLIGNMLFLFVFGGALENALGRLSFLLFYGVGGTAAVLGQTLWDTGSPIPMVGASGAIAAVLAGYLVLFPSAKVWSLFIIIPVHVRAVWVLGTWLVMQILLAWQSAGAGQSGGVAVWAHLGGFAAGAALTYVLVNSEEISGFRRSARIAGGLFVDQVVAPREVVAVPTGQRYVAPHPAQPQQFVRAPVPDRDPFAPPQQASQQATG